MYGLVEKVLNKLPFVVLWREDYEKELELKEDNDKKMKEFVTRIDCCLEVLQEWNNQKIGNLRAIREFKDGLLLGIRTPKDKFKGNG